MKEKFYIESIPAIVYGKPTEQVFLFIHGKHGRKEEGADFAHLVCEKGWQVLAIDLPGHGERKEEIDAFTPWNVVPELQSLMKYAKARWNRIVLRANSIGAYFSLLSYWEDPLEQALFVSPILDMENLIKKMMQWAWVSKAQLEQEKEIPTAFGETLSWEYYCYARENPIRVWNTPTSILYADGDNLTERSVVDQFVERFPCDLQVMEHGEHWFHTEDQLTVLRQWETNATKLI